MTGFRTINGAYKEIVASDPNTSIRPWFLRELVKNGQIPSVKSGVKYLIRMQDIEAYFENEMEPGNQEVKG